MNARRIAATGLSLLAVTGTSIATTTSAHADVIGNGITAPSHDSSLDVINLCRPVSWLIANFSDHNRDIANYKLNPNSASEIAQYAWADTMFHQSASFANAFGFANPAKYCTMDYNAGARLKADIAASNAAIKAQINASNAKLGLPLMP